jgi:hypothetical protein
MHIDQAGAPRTRRFEMHPQDDARDPIDGEPFEGDEDEDAGEDEGDLSADEDEAGGEEADDYPLREMTRDAAAS